MADILDKRIWVGQILAAHGIKGEVKLKSLTQDPLAVAEYGVLQSEDGTQTFSIKIMGVHKGALIAKIKGVADRNAAEALARTKPKLYIARNQLPEPEDGRYYIEDLKGFNAISANGRMLATVKNIHNYGAGDILELTPADGGKDFMLPFKAPYASEPDIKKRTIEIMIPKGWLEEEGAQGRSGEGRKNKNSKKLNSKRLKAKDNGGA